MTPLDLIARAIHEARQRHRHRPAYWEEQGLAYRLMMRRQAAEVLEALIEDGLISDNLAEEVFYDFEP